MLCGLFYDHHMKYKKHARCEIFPSIPASAAGAEGFADGNINKEVCHKCYCGFYSLSNSDFRVCVGSWSNHRVRPVS